jgi:hypothetical protein
MKTNAPLITALAVACLLLAPATRAETSASTGFDFTSGSYGLDTKTRVSSWNVAGEYSCEGWSAKVIAPYERVTGPVGLIVINGHPRLEKRLNEINKGKTQTASGIGDAEIWLSREIVGKEDWSASFSGMIKLPTGDDEKGLGSGKTDYGLSLDVSRKVDRFIPSLGVGYRFVGKIDGAELRDYFYCSAGLSYWLTDDTNFNITFESDQPASKGSHVDNEISVGVNRHFGQRWDVEFHLLAGLSNAAPDFGAGGSFRFSF